MLDMITKKTNTDTEKTMEIKMTRKYDCEALYYEHITVDGVTFHAQVIEDGDWKGLWNLNLYDDYEDNIFDANYESWVEAFGSLSECREWIKSYVNKQKGV